ncbi:TnsA endonuclease N-terminal domain-containing protein [Vibrio sp. F74]|uniref:TnsA endonuclease N-terminal domain-containing protein n=1 Tax=Vibrio sp. F74 TaxID=700020 RepID=UPI0035F5DF5F
MARSFERYEDYRRHLRNKWGQGEGCQYKPWFTTRDVKGPEAFRTEVFGLKTGRVHHFLSSKETQLFYILEYRDDVIDIREQFPLIPLEITQKIARTLGIEHPMVKKTGIPFIMTTDILVTVKNDSGESYLAFCVKPEDKLDDPRVLEKIEIERVWWELLGIPFQVFTGNNKTEFLSRNLSWVTDPLRSSTQYEIAKFIDPALALLSPGKYLKSDICDSFVNTFDIDSVDALNILRILISKKLISVDFAVLLETSPIITIDHISLKVRRVVGDD